MLHSRNKWKLTLGDWIVGGIGVLLIGYGLTFAPHGRQPGTRIFWKLGVMEQSFWVTNTWGTNFYRANVVACRNQWGVWPVPVLGGDLATNRVYYP